MAAEWELLLRLTLACIFGGLIGYEREARHKSAGLRTNMLVCLGACLIMILSQMIYKGVEGYTNADPARLAAQVVSGIGFLGAGAIMKEGLTVTGLTTAACLWVVAGVGLAVGAGYYSGAVFTTVLLAVVLGTMSRIDSWLLKEKNLKIVIETVDREGQFLVINQEIEAMKLLVRNFKVRSVDGNDEQNTPHLHIESVVYNPKRMEPAVILDRLKSIDGVKSVNLG